jgi:general secretion pathway protein E
MTIDEYMIDYDLSKQLTIEYMKENLIFPIQKQSLYINVATATNLVLNSLEVKFNTPIKYIYYSKKELNYILENLDIKQNLYTLHKKSLQSNINDGQIYILEFFDKLILLAIKKKSSDIHIESLKDTMIIRFRIDGHLENIFIFELEFFNMLSSIIKLLSSLDISQRRIPQDGRFAKDIENNSFDFRVSSLPTITGESIVLRILENSMVIKNMDSLGISEDNLVDIKESIKETAGMILVTGSTGSGKTTTLYSILEQLNNSTKKIITVEDPVEYHIENIQQVNINPEIGLTFVDILKNILRQDPDIIMIGEIRDAQSLSIAIQAALTGHLVLATLHTNDSISTINRLIDLKTPPYLVASTVKTIISQRLIRKLCENCKEKVLIDNKEHYNPVGCNRCNIKGYIGREAVLEVLKIDNTISSMILRQENNSNILKYAKSIGFKTIYENGLEKVEKGLTSFDELYSLVSHN